MKNFLFLMYLTVMTVCLVVIENAVAETSDDEKYQIIDQQADQWLIAHQVPSVAIAFIKDDSIAWSGVYGQQSSDTPATKETLYNIASMTKPVAAETILRLVSRGDLSLHEPLSNHWIDPDVIDDPAHKKLTPEIALTHRTGFPNWREEDPLSFQFEPGTKSSYSGEGYEYVARFAEQKTGQPFDQLAQTIVFDAIDMKSASFIERDWFHKRVAIPMGPDNRLGKPDIRTHWSAADDMHITVTDYAKFMLSVMRNEKLSTELSEKRFRSPENMFAKGCPWVKKCPERAGFALGWAVFNYADETVITHGGGDWGERTIGFFMPESNSGLVIFTNGANGSGVIKNVAEVFFPDSDFIAFLGFQANQ